MMNPMKIKNWYFWEKNNSSLRMISQVFSYVQYFKISQRSEIVLQKNQGFIGWKVKNIFLEILKKRMPSSRYLKMWHSLKNRIKFIDDVKNLFLSAHSHVPAGFLKFIFIHMFSEFRECPPILQEPPRIGFYARSCLFLYYILASYFMNLCKRKSKITSQRR